MQVELVKFDFPVYGPLEIARKKMLEHLVVECRKGLQDSLVGFIYGAQLEDGSHVHVCCSKYYNNHRDVEFARIQPKGGPYLKPYRCAANLVLTMTAKADGTVSCTGQD